MKMLFFGIMLLAICCAAPADDLVSSGTNNGIYAVVYVGSDGFIKCDEPIGYGFLCDSNRNPQILFPKREYLCNMELSDDKGVLVKKTATGLAYGGGFSNLTQYSPKTIEIVPEKGSGAAHLKFEYLQPNAIHLVQLPPAQELFTITQPGAYKMKIRFQVFEQSGKGSNVTYILRRLSPISISIVK